ncbi:FHA domain-containing protein [Clostridium thermopalmarium]|uniref:FHA domain-containing protein FhaB n=1 Tax=Clostridium thermopalmarium DSM 5974 TaxID=1121340 RepID=A0A2T0AKJ1_9CLOT|nr:FHA domain-containing protein [Clostridium thermopalmarium]PRR69085.1 FHA domain-containing protein FhaB [Clostridium thermopalmarium DSM 5974]PVZ26564.1 FHA domain-containing protein [Clostridium thermopalmarium DSM 5974]
MPLVRLVLRLLIIVIIYIIIFWALRIMYKDIKGGNRRRVSRQLGLEVIKVGDNKSNLKVGSVIPIHSKMTIGRREDNLLVLHDQYVSGHHAVIFIKNNEYFIKDLDSTNGTLLNGKRLDKVLTLKLDDEIIIGEYIFKVIG